MKRRQFPITVQGCALTINKSQGQSFNSVGIYLPRQIFSHGQLYVALSRCTTKENLKILVQENINSDCNIKQINNDSKLYVKNIVYTEVL